mgnify:CR=1 FL=1
MLRKLLCETPSVWQGFPVSSISHRQRIYNPPQLHRILKYSACSGECFVLALVYIDRLIQQHNLVLSTLNVHRVIITR